MSIENLAALGGDPVALGLGPCEIPAEQVIDDVRRFDRQFAVAIGRAPRQIVSQVLGLICQGAADLAQGAHDDGNGLG